MTEKNWEQLITFIDDAIYDKEYKRIINATIQPNREGLISLPAAKSHHHNYMGGLLDHTLEVLDIVSVACEFDKGIDHDLACSGAILHDIGKLRTYKFVGGEIIKTFQDKYHGHFIIGVQLLHQYTKFNEFEIFDLKKVDQIAHIIESHHGLVSNGWGSICDPQTPEANLVHYADLLSARVGGKNK